MPAAVTASPAAALAAVALLTAAGIATTALETLLVAAHGAVPASSTGDSGPAALRVACLARRPRPCLRRPRLLVSATPWDFFQSDPTFLIVTKVFFYVSDFVFVTELYGHYKNCHN